MLVRKTSVTLGNELKGMRENVHADLKRASDMYQQKYQEAENIRKQHTSLKTAYDALLPYTQRVRRGNLPAANVAWTNGSLLRPGGSRSTMVEGISSLQEQLAQAHARNIHLESIADEARGESKAMRTQYLNRVGEHREETRALLRSHGDRELSRTRATSLRLLARRVLYVLHTAPIRRAFLKWNGVACATRRSSKYRDTYGRLQKLEQANDELGQLLRREKTANRSLEGQLASSRSLRGVDRAFGTLTNQRPLKYGTVHPGQDMRVAALEEELARERETSRRATLETEKWIAAERRARDSEHIIRDQLTRTNTSLDYGGNKTIRPTSYQPSQHQPSHQPSHQLSHQPSHLPSHRPSHQPSHRSSYQPSYQAPHKTTHNAAAVSFSANSNPLGRVATTSLPATTVRPLTSLYGGDGSNHNNIQAPRSFVEPPTSDNRPPPPPTNTFQNNTSTSPRTQSRSVLGFGVQRLETKQRDYVQEATPQNSSRRRGSFFGMYRGTGGRKQDEGRPHKQEDEEEEVVWAHSKKDLLERVNVQTQQSKKSRQNMRNGKGRARRRQSLTGQMLL